MHVEDVEKALLAAANIERIEKMLRLEEELRKKRFGNWFSDPERKAA